MSVILDAIVYIHGYYYRTLNVNGQTYTLTPTQTLKITSMSSSLSWTAYNVSANGVVYYPSPSSGTAHPGTNTITYESEVTATGVSNEFVLVLNSKFWFFSMLAQVEYVMLIVSLPDAVPERG